MDALRFYGELGLGSRLKRMSDYLMKETQIVYDYFSIDFDPYLFPIFKTISEKKGITNSEIGNALQFSQPAITQALHKLNAKGLILYKNDKLDKRRKHILLSKKGKQSLKALKPIWMCIEEILKEYTYEPTSSLIEHLNKFENKLNSGSFSQKVIEKIKLETNYGLRIISFDNKYAKDFYNLNIEWLNSFFHVEAYDEEVLSKPQEYIINKGGHIFFAILNNQIVGTVALMPTGNKGIFELTKMAVTPKERGKKIGQQIIQYCIDYAKSMGLPKLVLYSNRTLENAIYLYRKYGFMEVPIELDSPYLRSDIKMELLL
ncbi:bifunctional helix-turn-helix transcriptional regulator/GNAT family N-acetyltransferase [Algibacter mikhailovii]|uniref:bifunctional helix-turn-helix transcriptional regulator/GNAT family N-acetyltransferase n=1 Tax=Algibacter mikhailovii TaxID=425498 RepID=UPI0024952A0A|nr:bifunctional helix-turn-helix transcriptional regulator/GNAT family N-acetyltransferase [Algibacter mikhailovii]